MFFGIAAIGFMCGDNTVYHNLRDNGPSTLSRNREEALEDAYRKLGVSRKSSLAEINAAFRKLSRQHHPDSPGGDTAKFIDITVAIGMIRLAFEEADAD